MLRLRKGFGLSGAWTVREQNRLLGVCFGLPRRTNHESGTGRGSSAVQSQVCDTPPDRSSRVMMQNPVQGASELVCRVGLTHQLKPAAAFLSEYVAVS